ncbi:YndJ family protein [Bacillus sp. 3103sda1]|uniref:YndJ family protein n=1 Tax=Bacillus sp. 3103sda1 TaxID=2953808 RepID=UPI00209D4879|nr:YndJ family protein [Bacillus sp. 3103sda1]MCP1123354.1 YndJ family protein [Bacillus sp. 3103sda1]
MRNIIIGLLCYVIFLILEWPKLHPVESIILLSILLFIPMAFSIVDKRKRDGDELFCYKLAVFIYPIAAISAMLAFVTNHFLFAIIWFIYTGIVALFGVCRLLERGWKPLEETAIDSGFMYLFLGGFWFFVSVANIPIMQFSSDIVLLTAAHFHYSAFLLPLSAGLLGRKQQKKSKLYTIVMFIIIISPMTVAIGITYSRIFEFFAVLLYLISLYVYGIFVWKTKFTSISAKVFLIISSSTLMVTILFSLLYSYGNFRGMMTISIVQMVWIHGVVNGIGVALPACMGWMIEKNDPKYIHYGKTMSRIKGKMKIGENVLLENKLIEKNEYTGLINKMIDFHSKQFNPKSVSPLIIDFYENTKNYELKATIYWSRWFQTFAFLYEKISRRVQQIHLGMGNRLEVMHGEIVSIKDEKDGRNDVRAWIRKNEQKETIFVALYSQHEHTGETYMNIALPLPYANMTGMLKLRNDKKNLIITSRLRNSTKGDEGIYLHSRFFTIRLPLAETFVIRDKDKITLTAHHQMWMFGVKFLEIDYEIEKTIARK